MNEFVEQFLIEAAELVEQATQDLLALEEAPADQARLESAFRAFHTMKGIAGIIDFDAMAEMVHAAEDVLGSVRNNAMEISTAQIADCLTCLDQVLQWLDQMQGDGEIPASAHEDARAVIARFAASGQVASHGGGAEVSRERPGNVSTPAGVTGNDGSERLSPAARAVLEEQLRLIEVTDEEGLLGRRASATRVSANVLRSSGLQDQAARLEALGHASDLTGNPGSLTLLIETILGGSDVAAGDALTVPAPEAGASRYLRVEVGRIDDLVTLTGELLIVKNAITHIAGLAERGTDPKVLAGFLQNQQTLLDRLVAQQQRSVLAMRVLPLRHVFQRFSRSVHDMSAALGKRVRLVIEGEATEADKTIVEGLAEPLLHVLRNAVDHGIESPIQRAAAGKAETATVKLHAQRRGEHVVIEIEDDGRGIDVTRVRAVATARGLAPAETIAGMSDEDVTALIFQPGFSTASEVSSVSGRGVGMDAVKTAIERMGGIVSVSSGPAEGTLVRFLLPFSVMLTRVMTVEVDGQAFGIPLDGVVETVRIPRADFSAIGAAQVFVLRSQTISRIDLRAALELPGGETGDADAHMVVLTSAGHLGAIEVDRLGVQMDVMLKPAEGLLAGIPAIAGTTVLGDGRVLLVLDPHEVLR